MNIITLLNTLKDAIANDEDTQNWCTITYGRDHKVYVNVDRRSQPGENDCPYVALYPARKIIGRMVDTKVHDFEIVCCIHDETNEIFVEANLIQYKGVERIEIFRKFVEDAIAGIDYGNLLLERVEVEYDTIDVFPFMIAAMLIRIREDWVAGTDILE